jgi:predicted TPR repeat methyltransferase
MDDDVRRERDAQAKAFFDDLWWRGDFWRLESSEFEHAWLARLFAAVADRYYGRALDIGCGIGTLTRQLASLAEEVLGLDVSQAAIERARRESPDRRVDFRQANVMDYDLRSEGPWDLVVIAETVYYLGWRDTFFDVAYFANAVFEATATGGRLLLANTFGQPDDWLVRPWIIRTYRDLFGNVGYRLEHEFVHTGTKDRQETEVLITLFEKSDVCAGA